MAQQSFYAHFTSVFGDRLRLPQHPFNSLARAKREAWCRRRVAREFNLGDRQDGKLIRLMQAVCAEQGMPLPMSRIRPLLAEQELLHRKSAVGSLHRDTQASLIPPNGQITLYQGDAGTGVVSNWQKMVARTLRETPTKLVVVHPLLNRRGELPDYNPAKDIISTSRHEQSPSKYAQAAYDLSMFASARMGALQGFNSWLQGLQREHEVALSSDIPAQLDPQALVLVIAPHGETTIRRALAHTDQGGRVAMALPSTSGFDELGQARIWGIDNEQLLTQLHARTSLMIEQRMLCCEATRLMLWRYAVPTAEERTALTQGDTDLTAHLATMTAQCCDYKDDLARQRSAGIFSRVNAEMADHLFRTRYAERLAHQTHQAQPVQAEDDNVVILMGH